MNARALHSRESFVTAQRGFVFLRRHHFARVRGGSAYQYVVAARESVVIFLWLGTGCALSKRCLFFGTLCITPPWQPVK